MPIMTAPLRVHIRTQIDAIARERLQEERVAFCPQCFEPYDKVGRGERKLCGCNPTRGIGRGRKAASPVAA